MQCRVRNAENIVRSHLWFIIRRDTIDFDRKSIIGSISIRL